MLYFWNVLHIKRNNKTYRKWPFCSETDLINSYLRTKCLLDAGFPEKTRPTLVNSCLLIAEHCVRASGGCVCAQVCGGALRRQLYYFTPKIVDSPRFFPFLRSPFKFSLLATRSAVTTLPEPLKNDLTLPPLWGLLAEISNSACHLCRAGGGRKELNRFFFNLERGAQRKNFLW